MIKMAQKTRLALCNLTIDDKIKNNRIKRYEIILRSLLDVELFSNKSNIILTARE